MLLKIYGWGGLGGGYTLGGCTLGGYTLGGYPLVALGLGGGAGCTLGGFGLGAYVGSWTWVGYTIYELGW